MTGTQQDNLVSRASALPTLLVGLSLLLNVGLASYLLNRRPAVNSESPKASGLPPVPSPVAFSGPVTSETPDATASDVPTIHWSEVESTDYRQYIANLRALGIPEQVVRDIIVTDVNQLYTKRAREIWQPRVTEYWQKSTNERPSPQQLEQLVALGKEHGALLQDLLGVRPGRQELIDLLYLQVEGSERQLLFLPPGKARGGVASAGGR